jgi:hypothetical protein
MPGIEFQFLRRPSRSLDAEPIELAQFIDTK